MLAGVQRTEAQRDLEGWRGLETENIHYLERGQDAGLAGPQQFRALAAAEFPLSFGGHSDHFRPSLGRSLAGGEQPIALANQQIAHVQCHRDPVLLVQRLFAVTERVVVLDVVVDQRRLVEALDRHGHLAEVGRKIGIRLAAESLISRDRQEGTPAFAAAHQPLTSDLLGLTLGGTHDEVERRGREPEVHLVAEAPQIQPTSAIIGGEMDVFPHPVQIHVGVDAIVLEKRHGNAGNRRRFHVRKGAFQNAQATNPNDRLNLAGLDEAHDDRRSLGHQHGVAQALRLGGEILDRTQPALLAQQTKFIEGRRTLRLHAQALRKQE